MFTSFERQIPDDLGPGGQRGAARGARTVDATIRMEPEASSIVSTMMEMFDLADAFCKAERLLSLQRTPDQREFHLWYLGEMVRQLAGERPRSWHSPGGGTGTRRRPARLVTRDPLRAHDLARSVARWRARRVAALGDRRGRSPTGRLPWATLRDQRRRGAWCWAPCPSSDAVRRSPTLARFLGPGLLGGFTTVSAMAVETVDLADTGHALLAFAYAAGSLVLCLVAAATGRALVHRLTEAVP